MRVGHALQSLLATRPVKLVMGEHGPVLVTTGTRRATQGAGAVTQGVLGTLDDKDDFAAQEAAGEMHGGSMEGCCWRQVTSIRQERLLRNCGGVVTGCERSGQSSSSAFFFFSPSGIAAPTTAPVTFAAVPAAVPATAAAVPTTAPVTATAVQPRRVAITSVRMSSLMKVI